MTKCEDCGMDNPPDNHECAQYEARMKAERSTMSTQELMDEFDARLTELERRVATLSINAQGATPWRDSVYKEGYSKGLYDARNAINDKFGL